MPFTICKLLVVVRIGGGTSQLIKLDPADQYTDILQGLDTDVLALQMLPRKFRVDHAGVTPSAVDCHDAVAPIVQNIGGGTFDISATPIKSGHVYSGGVWTSNSGFSFQLYDNSSIKSKTLPAKNNASANTMLVLDYLVQVSF